MLYAFDFQYAGFSVEAAQDDEKQVWISTPTVENLLYDQVNICRKKVVSKSFKAFAGEDFIVGKLRSKSTKTNYQVLYYSKETFLKILYFELSRQNKKAINLVVSGFVADFENSIQYALGNQLSEEHREYLRQLVFNRLQAFRAWTDIIRDRHISFYGEKPEGWYYGKLIKKANLKLFGVENFGSDRTQNMTEAQQETIRDFERFLSRIASKKPNLEPEALLDYCLDIFA